MSTGTFNAPALLRLAHKVLEGDVVFFFGSGASYDSEKNSAARLIRRLLLRVQACAMSLGRDGEDVLRNLVSIFDLRLIGDDPAVAELKKRDLQFTAADRSAPRFLFSAEDVDQRLSRDFYESNEWFCQAFVRLLEIIAERTDAARTQLIGDIAKCEEALRLSLGAKVEDAVPLSPIAEELLALLEHGGARRADAGKALFLDTMGFDDLRIMGGDPEGPLRKVQESYQARLLPRHTVVARFAREGWCPETLTTNFDMLLEGAFRLAGFRVGRKQHDFPPTLVNEFEAIASRIEFYTRAKAYRTAVLVKMHGCTKPHRVRPLDPAKLSDYLRSMVFTYREIQNWRTDSWAADYLRTLLRTRVVVFCGYSVRDPVIHDTFRTIYEEMAGAHRGAPVDRPAKDAPAFFLAARENSTRLEYHGTAVLQAASAAVGARRAEAFGAHPNYLTCLYRGGAFPDLDEMFRWLFHMTFRLRQHECLRADFPRALRLLLGRRTPVADREVTAVRAGFSRLVARERRAARLWTPDAASRRAHGAQCAWTETFHTALLREFACGELVRTRSGPGFELGCMRECAWYFPSMQDAAWTCWGAVLELALHHLAKAAGATIRAADCQRPTVFLQDPAQFRQTPSALTIHLAGFDRPGTLPNVAGHPWRRVFWELNTADAPWPRPEQCAFTPRGQGSPALLRTAPPHAEEIWQWALKPCDPARAREILRLVPLEPALAA